MSSNATSPSGNAPTKETPSTSALTPTSSKKPTTLSNTVTITKPHLTTNAKTSSAAQTRVSTTGSPSSNPSSSISVDPTPTTSFSQPHGSSSELYITSDLSSLTHSHAPSTSTLSTGSLPSSSNTSSHGHSGAEAGTGGLNKAIIAGAAIGAVALVAVVAFGVWFLRRMKKRQEDDDDISMVGVPRPEDVPMGMPSGIRLVRGNFERR